MSTVRNGSRFTLLPMGTWNPELGTLMDHVLQPVLGRSPNQTCDMTAPLSIWETDTHYHFEMDLPGVELSSVDMKLEKGVLHIVANRPVRADVEFIRQERCFGKIERLISLPDRIDEEKIEASLSDGVLSIQVPKAPEAQVKKIQVRFK
ncbi:MAG TPA: Hsp20/alpha crystallin family protein [Pirellulaceae bacterium]|mgnify:CR=1 FL=1|nr:Hsp20/alpha crystallin family protein [Pirellulaceae bacterium]HMO90766.1 Hsp20/alpha crystallin family protein [Pirellulaceae bacterium]HMP68017.1 Hsp20/alpha crystallin family protein [Pirellulaceae bacterium]